ncbi:flagellar protein FlgJ [Ruminiclostridium sufflavum DSM 19573]|uniref:Flagellar protein FlgJ n=1 Tax=Ruminiclostridium sufflavum DSM 19573 TaxID=1121337 RepID=A0A318XNH6_9FIRM|nr:rod-binding protein [Ruminiclostridium sufflavum]PYG88276.1 flagellar protein FlgJ [Ruminiclostridium sufflavum DSM 19573]
MEVGNVNSINNYDSAKNTSAKAADEDFEKRLKAAAESGEDAELKKVCNEFEGIFLRMMFKQMRATVPKSDYFSSDSATDMYNSMLDDELCDIAAQRGIGLGDMMYKQMSKQYGKQESAAQTSGGVIDEKK